MKITWFGHSNFRLDFAEKAVLIDPFFTGNPSFKGDRDAAIKGATHILVTHGHADHIGDTVAIARATGATVITNYELANWLGASGVAKCEPMNTGGTIDAGGFSVTLTRAYHSAAESVKGLRALAGEDVSKLPDDGLSIPLGHPNGIVVQAKGEPTIYHMGDTDVFSDMALIAELYRPEIVMVPIGDRFTMGAKAAALALHRFVHPRIAIPCHYGTFPILDQSADRFLEMMATHGPGIEVKVPRIGTAFET
ncbi:MAG: metal-dependent hydrolase [Hyphomicrobiales bacterium]|nr:metal-dependent hydrolase [Hyphomicrobiales bacterium]